jgi:hypothetical protein
MLFILILDLKHPVTSKSAYGDSKIQLLCNTTGYPIPSISWTHNKQSIVSNTSQLVVPQDATLSEYECSVKNTVGEFVSSLTSTHSCEFLLIFSYENSEICPSKK